MQGNEDEQADDDSGNGPGQDARAGNQERVLRYLCRDQPGRIAGEGEDKSVGKVDEPETRPGDRYRDRYQAVDRGDRYRVDDDEGDIHQWLPDRRNDDEASPFSLPACIPMMRSTLPSRRATFCSAMNIALSLRSIARSASITAMPSFGASPSEGSSER